LVAEGLRSQQIADRLQIGTGEVEVHRRNIRSKLGLHTIAELTRYAIREGLVKP
jgi:DNA-binding NarL/FixJ family response regulator